MHFTLRPHQKKQNKLVRKSLKTHDHVLYGASVGFGKSVAIWDMIGRDLDDGLRVLVLAPRRTLVFQLEQTFKKYVPHVMMGNIDRGDRFSGLILSSIQTTNSKLRAGSIMYEDIDRIYIDEAHIGCNFPPKVGTQFHALYEKYWDTAKWIGFSATPITPDGFRLEGWDDCIYQYQTGDLIDMGYLADFKYKAPAQMDLTKLRINSSTKEYDVGDVESAVTDNATVQSVVKQVKEHWQADTKCIVFCITITHAELIANALPMDAYLIHSKMSDAEQRRTLKNFKESKQGVLVNVSILTTGFDDPTVNTLVIARPIRTDRLAIQVWGRGLRLHGDKVCTILDMCNVHESCGFPDDHRDYNKVKPEKVVAERPKMLNGRLCEMCGEQSPNDKWRVKKKIKKRCIVDKMKCPACKEITERRTDFKKVGKLSEIITNRKHLKGLQEASEGIKTLGYAERKEVVFDLVSKCTNAKPAMSHYVVTQINKAGLGKMLDYVVLNYNKGNLTPIEAWKAVGKVWDEAKKET